MKKVHNLSSTLEIIFLSSNLKGVIPSHDDPMIISAIMVNTKVKKVFVDQGSLADSIFRNVFNKLGLKNSDLHTYKEELNGFSEEKVHPNRYITLHLTLVTWPKMVMVDFLVVDCPSAYNVILGMPTLNKIRVVISTTCLTMKFFTDDGEITTIKANQVEVRRCYNVSMEIQKGKKEESGNCSRLPNSSKVLMVNLDTRGWQEMKRPEPNRELEVILIG